MIVPTDSKKEQPTIADFPPPWSQHYLDMKGGRIENCIRRVRQASEEDMKKLPCSLLATAMCYLTEENELVEYAKALVARGKMLELNGFHAAIGYGIWSTSAVGSSAMRGFTDLLEFLLTVDKDCALTSPGPLNEGHALFLAIDSKEHRCIAKLFDLRKEELRLLLKNESKSWANINTLERAISRHDSESVRMLHELGDSKLCYLLDSEKSNLEKILEEIFPGVNISFWSKKLHWSFPHKDRQFINWIWHRLVPSSVLPKEIWESHILPFWGRGTLCTEGKDEHKCSLIPGAPWFASNWAKYQWSIDRKHSTEPNEAAPPSDSAATKWDLLC